MKPTGFWSYTSSDDAASGGRLSRLRRLLADALQLRIGRNPKVHIFQDVAAIPFGADWLEQIHKALGESSFLIPIVSPAFLQSEMCCREVMHFREREAALGRDDLIFPLHYIDVEDIDPHDPGECHDARVLTLLRSRQAIDFRTLRLRDPAAEAVAMWMDEFAVSLRRALRRQNGAGRSFPPIAPLPVPGVPAMAEAAAPAPSPPPLRPGTITRDGPDYPELVLIPAGSFPMGIPEEESEQENGAGFDERSRPLHQVTIARPFWLCRYPVTRGEYAAFVADTGYDRESGKWRDPGFAQTDRHPVVNVSADDAEAYAAWISRRTGQHWRLPNEAEWEYAARAGTIGARYWGRGSQMARYAHCQARRGTAPVDQRLPNGFGLHDMLGNVWEWVADPWHGSYDGAPDDGSVWTRGGDAARRVLRGGSWNYDARDVRAGFRIMGDTDYRCTYVGFRLARDAV